MKKMTAVIAVTMCTSAHAAEWWKCTDKEGHEYETSQRVLTDTCISNDGQRFVGSETKPKPKATAPRPASTNQVADQPKFQGPSRWQYQDDADRMTGKPTRFASVDALESLNFDFPYKGRNIPTLTIRRHPTYGLDVILSVDKGQFLCGVSGCSVDIKFDGKQPMRFEANGPASHNSTILFLKPAKRIVSLLQVSSTVLIQANFYKEGPQVITFPVGGLDWK
jgi:hypothetical protein